MVVAAAALFLGSPGSAQEGSVPCALQDPVEYDSHCFRRVDKLGENNGIEADTGLEGVPPRTDIGLEVYYPSPGCLQNAAPYPVLVLLHGWCPPQHEFMRRLAERCAAHGYVVLNMTPRHPCEVDNLHAVRHDMLKLISAAGLDELEDEVGPLKNRIDRDRLAIAGFSGGGWISTLAAANPTVNDIATHYEDERIDLKAVALFDPAMVSTRALTPENDAIAQAPAIKAPVAVLVATTATQGPDLWAVLCDEDDDHVPPLMGLEVNLSTHPEASPDISDAGAYTPQQDLFFRYGCAFLDYYVLDRKEMRTYVDEDGERRGADSDHSDPPAVGTINTEGPWDCTTDLEDHSGHDCHDHGDDDTKLDCDDPGIARQGGWHEVKDDDAQDGHYCRNVGANKGRSGAYLEFTFEGTGVELVYATGVRGGNAEVFIDGALQGTLECHPPDDEPAPEPDRSGRKKLTFGHHTAFEADEYGSHTFRLEVLNSHPDPRRDMVYLQHFHVLGGAENGIAPGLGGPQEWPAGPIADLGQLLTAPPGGVSSPVTATAGTHTLTGVLEVEEDSPLELVILDALGFELARSGATSATGVIEAPVPAAGTYTVVVANPSLVEAPYRIWLVGTGSGE